MARRPSTATLSSINSSSSLPKLTQFPSISQSLSQTSKASGSSPTWPPSRTVSGIGRIDATLQQDGSTVDPDELFVKHTVTEVKAIQHKFRNDADAKQQELRLMVGERYRDLLQASTSIISLAKSSDNVLHALDEMRGIASNVRNAQALPRMAPSVSHEDAHLQALQALSAHIKLLLDAPEHLWRLMERKLYLHSAWLFLLCRVVHRALLNDEEEDESSWNSYGLDVEEQFPLIQRQWDVVSQFRTQITHKATLSLREHSFSQSAVCASLLSLHLIESRPLPETLSILLTQRTRTLNSMLAKPHETAVNGDAGPSDPSQRKRPPRLRKAVVRSVQSKLEAVLEIISSTVGVARNLFVGSSGQKPLLADVLSFIQADPVPLTGDLPLDLRLTTPVLLSTLPSSGHFTQLPPNIKSYRPYIDDGVISTLSGDSLSNKLRQWFSKASEDIKQALGKWLSDLHTVTEIWTFRAAILRWSSSADGLEEYEKTSLVTILDEACLKQASAVWKDTLDSATAEFRDLLSRALGELRDSTPTSLLDASPVQYLFQAPSLTSPSQAGFKSSFSQESFTTYRNALKQRISCRTPLLDGVVTSVERSVDLLQRDFEVVHSEDTDSYDLSSNVSELFRSEAIAFCDNITTILEQGLKQSSPTTQELLFMTRVSLQLSCLSSFARSLQCNGKSIAAFQSRWETVSQQSVTQWRQAIVCAVVDNHWPSTAVSSRRTSNSASQHPHPSPSLITALLSLSTSVQQIGMPAALAKREQWSTNVLTDFISTSLEVLDPAGSDGGERAQQILWDLSFLGAMIRSWGETMQTSSNQLDALAAKLEKKLPNPDVNNIHISMDETLSRHRMLLAALLPASLTSNSTTTISGKATTSPKFVRSGTTETQYQPAIELVKPPPRFGLLLVGSTTAR